MSNNNVPWSVSGAIQSIQEDDGGCRISKFIETDRNSGEGTKSAMNGPFVALSYGLFHSFLSFLFV
jgi:hypothetical protein